MSRIVIIVFSCLFVGCVTPIKTSYDDKCNYRGMKLAGVNYGKSSSVSTVSGYNGAINSLSSNENVNCVISEDNNEKEYILNKQKKLTPVMEFNEKVSSNWLLRMYSYLLIIPGPIWDYSLSKEKNMILKNYSE